MSIFKNDSIEITTTEKAKKSSNHPQDTELSSSTLMGASAFAFIKENMMGMLPELALLIEEQQSLRLQHQENKIEALKSQIDQMEFLLMNKDFTPLSDPLLKFPNDISVLEQNFPEPFIDTTTVKCFIPASAVNARIDILLMDKSVMKSIEITNHGECAIEIESGNLQGGTYLYQLVIDEKVLHQKEMVVIK